MEVPKDKNEVPHYLPGQNPWIGEFEAKHAMPEDGVRGGAETLLPEWKPGAKPRACASRERTAASGRRTSRSVLRRVRCKSVHVQGNVHMIVGAGANIAVQVGEDGVLVVDTGAPARATRCWRRSRSWRPARRSGGSSTPGCDANHTGGNEQISKAGRTVNGNIAAIVAHENAAARMIKAGVAGRRAPLQHLLRSVARFPVQRRTDHAVSRRRLVR